MARESAKSAKGSSGSPGIPWKRVGLAVLVLFILLMGFGVSAFIDGSLAGDAKKEQEAQQKQMQEAIQKHKEDLERRQIALDARQGLQIQSTAARFQLVLKQDLENVNKTLQGFSSENLTDQNLAQNARAAREFGLALREYLSHVEGYKAFVLDSENDLKRLSKGEYKGAAEALQQLDEAIKPFREIAAALAKGLEEFAGTDPRRRQTIAEAVEILKGIQ